MKPVTLNGLQNPVGVICTVNTSVICTVLLLSLTVVTGNVINIQSGKWVGFMSGLGAGLDSFYEYLLKVMFCMFVMVLFKGQLFSLYLLRCTILQVISK